MFAEYIEAAMKKAKFKLLSKQEGYYGEIPGFQGVWSNTDTLADCRKELRSVLESWMLFRLREGLSLPVVRGISLNPPKGKKSKVA